MTTAFTTPRYPTLTGRALAALGPLAATARSRHLRAHLWEAVDRLPPSAPHEELTRRAVLHLLLHDVSADPRHEEPLLVVLSWFRGHRTQPVRMMMALDALGAAHYPVASKVSAEVDAS